jgi:hypothetical protein
MFYNESLLHIGYSSPVKVIVHLAIFSPVWMQLIAQLDLSSTWAFGVRWSPSGKTLAYAGVAPMLLSCPYEFLRSVYIFLRNLHYFSPPHYACMALFDT